MLTESKGGSEARPCNTCGILPNIIPRSINTEKVKSASYKVVDRDIEILRQTGHSEDQIFEATIVAAVGAGLERFQSALRALRGAGAP